jgi:predicted RNase H-like HicB family nuclease
MSEYVQAAMQSARFDELSNGGCFRALPRFHNVYAWGQTAEECYHALQSDLESAIEEALWNNRRLPEFVGIETPTLSVVEV